MGCITSTISMLLFQGEKFTVCVAVTALLWCLIATLVFTLAIGVGLGYNYCFVDIKTKYKYIAPRVRYPLRSSSEERIPGIEISGVRQDTHIPYHPTSRPYLPYQSSHYNDYLNPYPDLVPQRNLEDEEEATLPNLSGDGPNKIKSNILTASQLDFNKTATPPLNETATSINNTLINNTLDMNSTIAVNTTEVSNTTENITTIKESTEKVDIEEGFSKMSMPISGLDLIGLLTRLRAENITYTLQIVT